jgi:hypothetical protein
MVEEGDTLEKLAQMLSETNAEVSLEGMAKPDHAHSPSAEAADGAPVVAGGRMSPTEAEDWAKAKQLAFADIMAMPTAQREAQVAKLSANLAAEWALYVARHGSSSDAGQSRPKRSSGGDEMMLLARSNSVGGRPGRGLPELPSRVTLLDSRGVQSSVGSSADRSASPLQFVTRSRPSSTNAKRGYVGAALTELRDLGARGLL